MDKNKIAIIGGLGSASAIAKALAAKLDGIEIVSLEEARERLKEGLPKYEKSELATQFAISDFSIPKQKKKDKFPPARFLHRKK